MKVKLIKIEDGDVVVPLTLKVPIALYERLKDVVGRTKAVQQKSRNRANNERKKDDEVGQVKTSARLASKQSVILSILEHVLGDKSFKIDTE